MRTRAAIAFAAGQPLEIAELDLEGPRAGEVMVEIKATGICHTDEFTLSGADPEGLFPAILGHEGAGVVVEVGKGVMSVKKGDHVIPLYTPECRECPSCLSRKTNLCTAIRATQGQGLMPDGTSRFSLDGKPIHHYMGCSTFSNFTVLPEIAVAKVRDDAPFDTICYIGCGVTTGVGAVLNTAKVEAGAKCVVFGLGGIGLNVIQGLKLAGADMIIGVDLNPARKEWGERFGMTHFVNAVRGRRRHRALPRQPDQEGRRPDRRRRLQLRLHRQRQGDARGARMHPPRLGGVGDHRRGAGRRRDRDPAVPARHRPRLEGHRLRRRARAHRRAEDRRLVHGRQDPDRPADHPPPEARGHQQGLRPDARRRVDPLRGDLLTDALAVAHVSHAFGKVQALDDVSLTVPHGGFVALLGVNGAGKTTLFSLATRLYDNVSGRIEVCGHDLRRDPGAALGGLGVVFQSRALDADLTLAQNLAYHAALHGLDRATARARAAETTAQVGLADRLRTPVGQLSGGQQRRAEIARALLHRPRLLLLDEATAGLDVQSRREVARLVRSLAADAGVGVLWATHLFDEIEPGDTVVLLHRGRVLATDSAARLAGDRGLAEAFLGLTGLDRESLG